MIKNIRIKVNRKQCCISWYTVRMWLHHIVLPHLLSIIGSNQSWQPDLLQTRVRAELYTNVVLNRRTVWDHKEFSLGEIELKVTHPLSVHFDRSLERAEGRSNSERYHQRINGKKNHVKLIIRPREVLFIKKRREPSADPCGTPVDRKLCFNSFCGIKK